jgi:hypothetical protein
MKSAVLQGSFTPRARFASVRFCSRSDSVAMIVSRASFMASMTGEVNCESRSQTSWPLSSLLLGSSKDIELIEGVGKERRRKLAKVAAHKGNLT